MSETAAGAQVVLLFVIVPVSVMTHVYLLHNKCSREKRLMYSCDVTHISNTGDCMKYFRVTAMTHVLCDVYVQKDSCIRVTRLTYLIRMTAWNIFAYVLWFMYMCDVYVRNDSSTSATWLTGNRPCHRNGSVNVSLVWPASFSTCDMTHLYARQDSSSCASVQRLV